MLLACGLGAWVWRTPEAQAQLLPAEGADVRVGDLRRQFLDVFGTNQPPVAAGPAWTFTPALDLSESYDDGVQLNNGTTATDLITRISPSLLITGDSSRLRGNIFFEPSANIFAFHSDQNNVGLNGNADVTATLVPDLLFLDLRGYASQGQLNYLTTAPGPGTSTTSKSNSQQIFSFSATPYIQHSFGDTGTLYVGYTITQYSASATQAAITNNPLFAPATGSYTSQEETASFTTGPAFDRFNNVVSATAVQYNATGSLEGAYSEVFNNQSSFAVNRWLALTGSFGHENYVYPHSLTQAIDDFTWSGGVRLTPGQYTIVNVSYGHQQGNTNWELDGTIAPTARSRIYARYTQGVTTQLQQVQQLLGLTSVNINGQLVSSTTGAPIIFIPTTALTNSVFRTTAASIGGALLYDRDTFTLDFVRTVSIDLSPPSAGSIGSNNSTYTNGGWQHSVSEATSTSVYLQYGTIGGGTLGTQQTFGVTLSVNYIISQTLSAWAQFTRYQTNGASFGQPPVHDIATVGLHKTF
jgi:uncharacterized protein (PEP-CTERM system associated)